MPPWAAFPLDHLSIGAKRHSCIVLALEGPLVCTGMGNLQALM